MLAVVGEQGLCFIVCDAGMNNDIVSLLPVDGCSYTVFVAELERINNTKNLVEIAPSGGRVSQGQTNNLLGIDDENSSDCERKTLCVAVGCVLLVQHIIQRRDLPVWVGDDGELNICGGNL